MAAKAGDILPSATLVRLTESGPAKVSTDDLKGKPAVILFFPLVNTGVCEKELCAVRDGMAHYDRLAARVVAISVDSPFAQKLWAEKHGFKFELWSDFNKEAIAAFGCRHDDLVNLKGVAKRSVFVTDRSGTIRMAWISDDPKQLPNFDEVQATLAKLN